jgi:hypothetical protein
MYRNAFGPDPAVWRAASPVAHLDRGDPPELVVVRGTPGRRQTQAGFAAALRAEGIPTTVVPTPGWSHEDVNLRLGSTTDQVLTPPVESFLDRCFA